MSYEYDEYGNCLHMWDNNGTDICYSYDKNGNIIRETEQLDGLSAGMSYLNMTVMAEWKHLQMPTGTRRRISMKVDLGIECIYYSSRECVST